jgi:Uma2 family endonuclease
MSLAPVPSLDIYPRRTGLRMSYDEFLELGDEYRHAEWVNGEVVMMAAVTTEHGLVTHWLARLLGDYCEITRSGVVLGEPVQVKLVPTSGTGRAPDVFVVLKQNESRLKPQFLDGPADLAIEVISPGTRRVDRVDKFQEYERGGVPEYWIIDPERKQAEFYRLNNGRYEEYEPDAQGVYHSSSVAGFWLKPEWLWERPLPTTIDILREMKIV